MVIVVVSLSVLFCLLLYLLFAPIGVEINSAEMILRVRFHYLASLTLTLREEPKLILGILGWRRVLKTHPKRVGPDQATNKKFAGMRRGLSVSSLIRMLRSFKVTRCHIDVDFGDMQLNGIVYPLFWWMEWRRGIHTRVNFTGRNEVVVELRNNIARMARAYIGR